MALPLQLCQRGGGSQPQLQLELCRAEAPASARGGAPPRGGTVSPSPPRGGVRCQLHLHRAPPRGLHHNPPHSRNPRSSLRLGDILDRTNGLLTKERRSGIAEATLSADMPLASSSRESSRKEGPFAPFGGFFQRVEAFLESIANTQDSYAHEETFAGDNTHNHSDVTFNSPSKHADPCLPWKPAAPENKKYPDWSPTPHSPELHTSAWAHRPRIMLYSVAALLSLPAVLPGCLQPALAEELLAPTQNAPQEISREFTQTQESALEPSISRPQTTKYSGDTTVTQRVYLDFSLCPSAVRLERTLGDRSLICSDGEPLGRVVLGLYGKQVPVTVKHFEDMVTGQAGSSYRGSVIQKSLPGQYILAGRQGAVEKGEVQPPSGLELNPETVQSKAFLLGHERPGTVSLALSVNDDEDAVRQGSQYRNVEFLITTGPGPASQLDSQNVVFGRVLDGMDVVRAIAAVPTYQPNDQIKQFNDLAVFLGDERAAKGRARWNKPMKSVVISDCGVVEVSPPLLPPSLP